MSHKLNRIDQAFIFVNAKTVGQYHFKAGIEIFSGLQKSLGYKKNKKALINNPKRPKKIILQLWLFTYVDLFLEDQGQARGPLQKLL